MSRTSLIDPGLDLLREHFSGKRSAERLTCSREVVIEAHGGSVLGRALDVSEGGVLVALVDDEFLEASASGPGACVALAERRFRGTMRLRFAPEAEGLKPLDLPGEVVRIT